MNSSDFASGEQTTALPFPKLAQKITCSIGPKLTAYIASMKDLRALDRRIESAAALY